MELTAKELLTHLYQTAIDSVDGRFCVQRWCRDNPGFRPDHIVAIGKAAPAMLQGAMDIHPQFDSALMVTREARLHRSIAKDQRIDSVFSSHPVPDESSLRAGDALIRFLDHTDDDAGILFLISGGTSSLIEVLHDDIDLDTLQAINQHLLASGKSIHEMNAWRKQFSRIKGGGLLEHIGDRACTQLLISDVKGDDTSVIGSGLLVENAIEPDDDAWLRELRPQAASNASGKVIDTHIVATLQHARQASHEEAIAQGVESTLYDDFIEGEAAEVGREIAGLLKTAQPGVHIFGGETTVTLPDKPGVGGRNQSFALSMCESIEGEDICVLCAGTDGIDGNTPCAGALVTGDTAPRARQMGFDISAELDRANAGTVLMATGDLYKPGASNTNVMDIVIAYKRS